MLFWVKLIWSSIGKSAVHPFFHGFIWSVREFNPSSPVGCGRQDPVSQPSSLQGGRLRAGTRAQSAAPGRWLSPLLTPGAALSIVQFWAYWCKRDPEEGNHDLEGAGVLDLHVKAEDAGSERVSVCLQGSHRCKQMLHMGAQWKERSCSHNLQKENYNRN